MQQPFYPEFGKTRRKILELLRATDLTSNQIAGALGITHNAVRSHLAALSRAGLVRKAGLRRGTTRPATTYELEPRADSLLSRAYVPFISHLLEALDSQMSGSEINKLMRTVGRSLSSEWPRPKGPLERRIPAAVDLLAELGAMTSAARENGTYVIRGKGCLLAEAIHGKPFVCRAIETLLAEFLTARVEECCERGRRPHCCFRISAIS